MITSAELKSYTQNAHLSLEKKLISKIQSIENKEDYASLLKLMYGYYEPMERNIEAALDSRLLPDFPERRKSASILEDLRSLNCEADDMPLASDIPALSSNTDAFAALYVMEGSTLGGKIIAKMISKKLGNDTGLSFFSSYNDDAELMWKRFKLALDALPLNEEEESGLYSTATAVFQKFEHWIILNEQEA